MAITTPLSAAGARAGRPAPRPSPGTGTVLRVLQGRTHPATALGLLTELRGGGEQIGLSTIYRSLHTLTRTGVLHQLHLDGHASYLACGPGTHDHLVCEVCQRVQPWVLTDRDTLDSTARAAGFVLDAPSLVVVGRCSECPAPA